MKYYQPERIRQPIGQRDPHLRQLVEEMDQHWTQQDIAERTNTSQGFLHNLRKGRKEDYGFLRVKRVAEALGFELRFIRKQQR